MIAATIIIILPMIIGIALIAGTVRRLVREEADVERRLRGPDVHRISYALPRDVDPEQFRGLV
jgi:hypothetical protein